MTKSELLKMISVITEDIQSLQDVHGWHCILDPNSEAAKLSDTKQRLQRLADTAY